MTHRDLICRTSDERYRVERISFSDTFAHVTLTHLNSRATERITYPRHGFLLSLREDFAGTSDLDVRACMPPRLGTFWATYKCEEVYYRTTAGALFLVLSGPDAVEPHRVDALPPGTDELPDGLAEDYPYCWNLDSVNLYDLCNADALEAA